MMAKWTIGLDFGTNSVRALLVNIETGEEAASAVWNYPSGEQGVILDSKDAFLARQNPLDYLKGLRFLVPSLLRKAARLKGFAAGDVIGIGVDATGSSPMPADGEGEPLARHDKFKSNPHAMVWLWKDHTSHAEAAEITALARRIRPHYLAKCGGTYSSEWFWSKLLRCARVAPEVFDAIHTWVEISDWIPAMLTGTQAPAAMKRGICAAGHKGMFHPSWGGYPEEDFWGRLDKRLVRIRRTLPKSAHTIAKPAGGLSAYWAKIFGLPAGTPVAVGALDAHLGAVGSGIRPETLVKIIGTSTCDMMIAPLKKGLPDIPGLCGIVPESILPGYLGLEAGQSAVGDIFNWFVREFQSVGSADEAHKKLSAEEARLQAGESGLLALDWHNGNRTILVDQRLTGLLVGMTLRTKPAEVYRALIEATAFGARRIIERLEEYGAKVRRVINCGGISVRSPLAMQIYADVIGRDMEVSQSEQTCALGAAIAAAVAAGRARGGYANFASAIRAMTSIREKRYTPQPRNVKTYNRLYEIYKQLHDVFGLKGTRIDLSDAMKELLAIRGEV